VAGPVAGPVVPPVAAELQEKGYIPLARAAELTHEGRMGKATRVVVPARAETEPDRSGYRISAVQSQSLALSYLTPFLRIILDGWI